MRRAWRYWDPRKNSKRQWQKRKAKVPRPTIVELKEEAQQEEAEPEEEPKPGVLQHRHPMLQHLSRIRRRRNGAAARLLPKWLRTLSRLCPER